MWLDLLWPMIAAACLTLAAIHTHVWWRHRRVDSNAAFAVLCACVAWIAFGELRQLRATTVADYLSAVWWNQAPVFIGIVAVIVFVRRYMGAGRTWLAGVAIGMRLIALVLNFVLPNGIQWQRVDSMSVIALWGQTLAVPVGVPHPALIVAHLSLLLLVVFVLDASVTVWRRGDRRSAAAIGGSLVLFVALATMNAIVHYWLLPVPLLVTVYFVPIVFAMGFELSRQLLRSAQLSADLSAKDLELRSSEQKLELAAEAANAGLWRIDPASGRLWATPRALAMFELQPDTEHHMDEVLRSIHPDDLPAVKHLLERNPRSNRRVSIEYRVRRTDGEVRWYASHGSLQDEGPKGLGLMGVTIDITERKQAEEETARQRQALEHLSRVATLSELSGALAHELNQPLAIIMSNAEAAQLLLRQDEPDLEEIRAILGDIVDADQRAGDVILRLRRLLKRGQAQREAQSLNTIAEGVLQFMRGDLAQRGVTVALDLAHGLPLVALDRVPMEQVLINLVNNACDAMAGNAAGDRQLTLLTRAVDEVVELAISDCGSGLPAAPERVFEPFFTTKAEGLGMGLAISRSIVAVHGGTLDASNNAARGATLRVRLPVMPILAQPAPATMGGVT